MIHHQSAAFIAIVLLAGPVAPSRADDVADKAAITQRLQRWTADFNARDAAGACDLFAPDLAYSIPEIAQGTKQTMCENLARVLARTDIRVSYKPPDVHEIIVSGEIAVVRLTWTLTAAANVTTDTTTEEGMDIFRRQPDGRWSIARYVAFTTRQNEVLR